MGREGPGRDSITEDIVMGGEEGTLESCGICKGVEGAGIQEV